MGLKSVSLLEKTTLQSTFESYFEPMLLKKRKRPLSLRFGIQVVTLLHVLSGLVNLNDMFQS